MRHVRRLPGHLRPRRLRIYGIGLGKSGTTTLARMFDNYRAGHEVDAARLLPLATAVLNDEIAQDEASLEEAALQPIASYFRSWGERNEQLLSSLPSDRLLVVRTEDLDVSCVALARFAGVRAATVHTAHANHNDDRSGLLA